ncbi:MAG: GNAT family N-acetyltransferase [Nitrososphaerales archaeon]|jgi:predicted N-acetyltransferase YhbS
MRILTHDELPPDLETDLQLLRLSVGWPPRDFRRLSQARRLGYPAADYIGLYAVEDGRVLSTVRAVRVPFTFPDGHSETVSTILSVITRRDCRGRGLARSLIDEVNARERRAGSRFCFLWTEQSLSAHQLYERMGYRDLYVVDLAMRRPSQGGSRPRPGAYTLERLKDDGAATVERLHAVSTRGRTGFTPRHRGFIRSDRKLGLSGSEPIRLVLKDGRPVGYVALDEAPGWVSVSEVVLTTGGPSDRGATPAAMTDLVADLERLAARRWLSVWNTVVRDLRHELDRRGYAFGTGDRVVMSLPLDGSPPDLQVSSLGTTDRRFTCQLLDYF